MNVYRNVRGIYERAALVGDKPERHPGNGRIRSRTFDYVYEYAVVSVCVFVFAGKHFNYRVACRNAEDFAVSYFDYTLVVRLPVKPHRGLICRSDRRRELLRFVYAYRDFSRILFVARRFGTRSYIDFVGIVDRVRKRAEIVYTINSRVERVVVYLKIEIAIGYRLVFNRFVIVGNVKRNRRGRIAIGINRSKVRIVEFQSHFVIIRVAERDGLSVTVIEYVYIEIYFISGLIRIVFIRLESEFIIRNFGRFGIYVEGKIERFIVRISARIIFPVFAYVVENAFDVEFVLFVVGNRLSDRRPFDLDERASCRRRTSRIRLPYVGYFSGVHDFARNRVGYGHVHSLRAAQKSRVNRVEFINRMAVRRVVNRDSRLLG